MIRKIIVLGACIFLGSASPAFSQTPREKDARGLEQKARELRDQDMEEIKERSRRSEEAMLSNLKKYDPPAYQARMKMQGLSQKISEIVVALRQGQLAEGEARKKLFPLVKEVLGDRINHLDREIEMTSKKLDYLRKAKANPASLINHYIDSYLGKSDPLEEMLYR
jgi:hypothetical protein